MGQPEEISKNACAQPEPLSSKGRQSYKSIVSFEDDELSYDHGLKAWSQVIASFLLYFNTW